MRPCPRRGGLALLLVALLLVTAVAFLFLIRDWQHEAGRDLGGDLRVFDPTAPEYDLTPSSNARFYAGYYTQGTVARAAIAGSPRDLPPLVSVVVPFRDAQGTLAGTLTSILRQSLQRFEVLIVDDHSITAGALGALQQAALADARVRVLRPGDNRQGLSAARNTGFAAARAPYVMMLDADDQLEPTVLEKSAWFLFTHPTAGFVKGFTVGALRQGKEMITVRGKERSPSLSFHAAEPPPFLFLPLTQPYATLTIPVRT